MIKSPPATAAVAAAVTNCWCNMLTMIELVEVPLNQSIVLTTITQKYTFVCGRVTKQKETTLKKYSILWKLVRASVSLSMQNAGERRLIVQCEIGTLKIMLKMKKLPNFQHVVHSEFALQSNTPKNADSSNKKSPPINVSRTRMNFQELSDILFNFSSSKRKSWPHIKKTGLRCVQFSTSRILPTLQISTTCRRPLTFTIRHRISKILHLKRSSACLAS